MKNLIQTAFAFFATLTLSFAMTSCDNSNEPNPDPNPNVPATITSNYSVILGDAFYRYFDITVEYTTPGGQIETKTISEDWIMNIKLNAEEAPNEFVCKVKATPKNPLPEITDGTTYDLSKDINASVTGHNSKNEQVANFGYIGNSTSSEIRNAEGMRKFVSGSHNLLNFSYTNPNKK